MTDTNQLPPMPNPKFTETIRGVPCITLTEHEHLMRAYALQARAQVQGEPFGYIHHFAAHDESGALIDTTWEADGCADPLPHPTFPAMWKWAHCTPFYTTPQPAQATQAEAQQPATGEPVGFVDFQGTVFWHDGPPPADSLLFAAKPVSHDKAKWCEYVAGMVFTWLEMQENLKEEDRCIKAIAGIIERRMWALLTTHPAPSVPDDVVRDAERYRWLLDNGALGFSGAPSWRVSVSFDAMDAYAQTLDSNIDAAMLAAK